MTVHGEKKKFRAMREVKGRLTANFVVHVQGKLWQIPVNVIIVIVSVFFIM